jgi:hypothetical protein
MRVTLLHEPEGNVIARGSYGGGPEAEFVVAEDGHVDIRATGDCEVVWAGPNAESFRRIATAWNRYCEEVRALTSEALQIERVRALRLELTELGALPLDLPPDPEPLWSLVLFETEHGLL